MARKPDIKGDRDNWGAVLNDYLDVSLAEDGTIKDEAAAALPISDATRAALDAARTGPAGAVLMGSGSSSYWADPDTGDRVFRPDHTIHFVGDMHYGMTNNNAPTRRATFEADAPTLNASIAHRVYVGDIQETPNDADELAAAVAGLNSVDTQDRWDLVAGNHDIGNGLTGTAFMAQWGYASRNWTRDLDFCRLIGLTPDAMGSGGAWLTLTQEDLDFLDSALAGTNLPCVIVTHAPLYDTVTYGAFPSTDTSFYTHPDADIRAILNAHDNAYMWVSGHTHTPNNDPDIVKLESVGSRDVIALNCSAIAYSPSEGGGQESKTYSPVVTFESDAIAVRWRNHTDGAWMSLDGSPVRTVPAQAVDVASPTVLAVLSPDGSATINETVTPTESAGVTTVAGHVGNAWAIVDGEDGVRADLGDVFGPEGEFLFWLKVDAATTDNYYLYLGDGGASSSAMRFNAGGTSSITYVMRDEANTVASVTIASGDIDPPLLGGGWRLHGFAWDETGVLAHVDIDGTRTDPVVLGTPAGNVVIGGGISSGNSKACQIGPFAGFRRKLTDAERRHFYHRTAPWTLDMIA